MRVTCAMSPVAGFCSLAVSGVCDVCELHRAEGSCLLSSPRKPRRWCVRSDEVTTGRHVLQTSRSLLGGHPRICETPRLMPRPWAD